VGETAEEYTARMLGLSAGKDPLKVQAATPGKLRRLVASAPRRLLTRSPEPGKWSVAQIVAHLADTETVFAYRLRMILSRDGTEIQAFDQEKWAEVEQYERVNTADALAVFAALRRANLALVKRLGPAQRRQFGLHQERGKETIDHMGKMNAGHDLNHLAQIERILGSPRTRGSE
jgi:DinB superfamily